MKFEAILKKFEEYKEKYGEESHRHISEILDDIKPFHKEYFENRKDNIAKRNSGLIVDHEQSWKSFLGNNIENFFTHILKDEIRKLGLEITNGKKLANTLEKNLSVEMVKLKMQLIVCFGEYGFHFPDADIILYFPNTLKVFAIISSKTSLRERIAQTGYWKIKFSSVERTEEIKVFFMTIDKDKEFSKFGNRKSRAIAEVDTDGCYVLTASEVRESSKVKTFDSFIDDLRELLKNETA